MCPSPEQQERSTPSDRDGLERIRSIVLENANSRLADLEHRLSDNHLRAEEISQVLIESIYLHGKNPEPLAKALQPSLEESIRNSVAKNPNAFGDALFPVMGPAIRKSILETIRSMVQSMNQVVENSLSIKGLKWRWEAFRTKKSYGEVAFLHSMKYRVEQVFLIHRETGLLLIHAVNGSVPFENADAISGMLTAIQDFVRDSFGGTSQDELNTMQVGELAVWTEGGPHAVLAITVRGTPPRHLFNMLQTTLEHIHLVQHNDLKDFDGNTAAFEQSRPDLENCLLQETQESENPNKRGAIITGFVFSALVFAFCFFLFHRFQEARDTKNIMTLFDQTPGIVFLNVQRHDGKLNVKGLRDPLALLPPELSQFSGETFSFLWDTYYSLEPEMVLARANHLLKTPPLVSLELKGETLLSRGVATEVWSNFARERAPLIPGVLTYNDRELSLSSEALELELRKLLSPPDTLHISFKDQVALFTGEAPWDWIEKAKTQDLKINGISGISFEGLKSTEQVLLTNLIEAVDATVLFYEPEMASLTREHKEILYPLSGQIKESIKLATTIENPFVIDIEGHTDSTGTPSKNRIISEKRAQRVADFLIQAGVPRNILIIKPMSSGSLLVDYKEGEDQEKNRKVILTTRFKTKKTISEPK